MANSKMMMNSIQNLGKKAAAFTTENVLVSIDINLLDEHPENEKIFGMTEVDELCESIGIHGFNQPIGVRKKENGRYEIVFGHRRYRAKKQMGATRIDAIIGQYRDENDVLDALIMSNILSRKLKPTVYAKALKSMKDGPIVAQRERGEVSGHTYDILAKKFGISSTTVARYLRLLNLITPLQEKVDNEEIIFEYTSVLPLAKASLEIQNEVNSEIDKLYEAYKEQLEKLPEDKKKEFPMFCIDAKTVNALLKKAETKSKGVVSKDEGKEASDDEMRRYIAEKKKKNFMKKIKSFSKDWQVISESKPAFNEKEVGQLRELKEILDGILQEAGE